jgi:dienelactone hydrolase
MNTLLLLLLVAAEPQPRTDWPGLVQKPYADLAVPDLGLRPLLVNEDGKKITTPAEWEKARAALRQRWLDRLGKAPERPDSLDVRVESTEKQDGYTRQLVSFRSEGDDRIRAYLLQPADLKEKEKRPAIVVFHPTTRETFKEPAGLGKRPEMALAVQLVRRGYVTLSPECYILKDPDGWAKGQAEALAKRRPGWTGMGKMTFDASRCADYLETVPAVDKGRIGCIGHSLGAKEVLYALAFEPRYRVGVFNEGGIGLRLSNWTDPWYLTEKMKEHIPQTEHHQLLALVAPRPLLILGGDDGSGKPEIADGDKSWPFVKAALPVYELLGAGNRLGLYNHKGRHSFPKEARRLAYRWLDDWLGFTPVTDEVGE